MSGVGASPPAGGSAGAAATPPPGLRRQLGTTRGALLALVRAHVDLAKAEAGEIVGEISVVAAAVGLAIAALILVAFLIPIGLFLFFGEWLFGSLGWGVLLGTEFLLLLAAAGVLSVLRAGNVGRSIVVAFIAGTIVAILFGTNAPNLLYSAIADQLGTTNDPGDFSLLVGAAIGAVVVGLLGFVAGARNRTARDAVLGLIGGAVIGAILGALVAGLTRLGIAESSRPMVVGLVLVGAVVALVGLVLGARNGGGAGGAATGLVMGFVFGGALGAFSAITFTWHVAIAIGLALWLGLALGLMLADVASRGIDTEALKERFVPTTTIETAKETLEWAKARIPRGPTS
jgi:hypothetical protein